MAKQKNIWKFNDEEWKAHIDSKDLFEKVKEKFNHIELAQSIIEDSNYLEYLRHEEKNSKNPENLSEFHWTVDRIEDFEFVKSIIKRTKKRPILMNDILKIIENEPDLLKINSHVDPFEGYKKSINDD